MAIEKVDAPIRVACKTGIVRHDANRRAFAMQISQQLHHGLAIFGIEITGRFVRQEDRRLPAQCSRHGHALLLAAGELRRIMLGPM